MSLYCNVTECSNWKKADEPATTRGLLERTYTGTCSRTSINVEKTSIVKRVGGYKFDLSICSSMNRDDEQSSVGINCFDDNCKFNTENVCIKLSLGAVGGVNKDANVYIDIDDRGVAICKSQAVKSRRDFVDWARPYDAEPFR